MWKLKNIKLSTKSTILQLKEKQEGQMLRWLTFKCMQKWKNSGEFIIYFDLLDNPTKFQLTEHEYKFFN